MNQNFWQKNKRILYQAEYLGVKSIENIIVGDEVLSYNEVNGKKEYNNCNYDFSFSYFSTSLSMVQENT